MEAFEESGLLYVGLPFSYTAEELQGQVIRFSIPDGTFLGPFIREDSEPVTAYRIFKTENGNLAVVTIPKNDMEGYNITLYTSSGEYLKEKFLPAFIPVTGIHLSPDYYSFLLTAGGDLLVLCDKKDESPGEIRRYAGFFKNSELEEEIIEGNQYRSNIPVSRKGPFRFNSIRRNGDFIYLTVELRADPFDGILVLNTELEFIRYITGQWHFNFPYDIAFDNRGVFYVSNLYNANIKAYTNNGLLTVTAPDDFNGSEGHLMNKPAAMSAAGNHLYVYDSGNGRINCFETATQGSTDKKYKKIPQLIIPRFSDTGSVSFGFSLFFFGIIFMIIIHSFFSAVVMKERRYFFFGLLNLGTFYFILEEQYYRFIFRFPEPAVIGTQIVIITAILFFSEFLPQIQSRKSVARIYKTCLIISLALLLLSVFGLATGLPSVAAIIISLTDMITGAILIIMLGALIYISVSGNKEGLVILRFSLIFIVGGFFSLETINDFVFKYHIVNIFFSRGLLVVQIGIVINTFIIFHYLNSRFIELKTKNIELTLMDKNKTDFILNVSHELRTPLTIIRGITDQLKAGRWGDSIRKNRDLLMTIDRNSNRLLKQINNLLELSRLEQKKKEISREKIDLTDYLKLIVSEYSSGADMHKINLKENIQKNLIVYADPILLETAVLNLLSNAFKFTHKEGTITVTSDKADGLVRIIVSDTGIGIPLDKLDYIFDRFYQGQNGSEYRASGTGIGLSLVKEIVELHNGRITVESTIDKGTMFTLIFPDCSSNSEYSVIKKNIDTNRERELLREYKGEIELSNQDPWKNNIVSGSKRKILIVEDNQDLRNFLYSELSVNFSVSVSENGINALELLLTLKPDLIISDIMMPKMDGLEFYEKLLEDDRYVNIPFLFLTARATPEERVFALKKGALDYIEKPFSSEELIAKAETIIGNNQKFAKNYRDEFKISLVSFVDNYDHDKKDPQLNYKKLYYEKNLTPREIEIADCIRHGMSDNKIAEKLLLSPKTIANCNTIIYKKLEVSGRIELISIGLK